MQVYLVRHTETVCPKGICYGQSDVDLKEDYIQEFEKIKEQLPKDAIVFSSPLKRCKLLADYVYSEQEDIYDSRLKEMNFGSWELQAWDKIPEDELNPWMSDFVSVRVPEGESFEELYSRVIEFWKSILNQSYNKPIVIITHAGVIRSLLCYFQNLALKDAFNNKVDYGEHICVNL